jgi:CRP-like cAMP-binding protein
MADGVAQPARLAVLGRSMFGILPGGGLHRISHELTEVTLPAGRLLYDAEVSVVLTGMVRAFIAHGDGRQVTVSYLRRGDTLGLGRLAGRTYPTAFQAIPESRLLHIGDQRYDALRQAHPQLGWTATQELAKRLDELEAELGRAAFSPLRQRLAAHLLALTSVPETATTAVHLAQLSTAVGSAREVVSRTLTPLAREGLISLASNGVLVRDRGQLRRLAVAGELSIRS